LKQFPYWDPVKDNMPMTYKRFCEASTEDFRAKIRYAPPCERLRHLKPTRSGWWSFLGNPLAPRTAYGQLKTLVLKCGDVGSSVWKAWLARAPFGTNQLPLPQRAVDEFCVFLSARGDWNEVIKKIRVESTREKPENNVLKEMASGEKGFWIVCELVDADYDYVKAGAVSTMVTGWHASSMYSVWRMLSRGPDFAFETKGHNKRAVTAGFYYHLKQESRHCAAYATYSPLSESGFYYAPFFELRTPQNDPDWLAVSAGGSNQRVCQPHCTRFTRLLVHVIHMRDVFAGEKATQFNLTPGWAPTYEMDPDDSMETFASRCEENKDMDVETIYLREELTAWEKAWH
jgi:hypothetical protein